MLKAQLGYADRGKPTFPCEGKRPLTRHGFKDASTDPRRIHMWRNRWPHANVGMPTGERSGVWVLDVDRAEALEALEAKVGQLPTTATVRTPRGGLHLYFRHAEGVTNSCGGLPKGIDVRGEGGYVLVAPSAGYSWEDRSQVAEAPEALLELVKEQRPEAAPARRPGEREAAGRTIPEGRRNAALTSIAGGLHDGTRSEAELAAELLAIRDARCEAPETFPDAEVRTIARWVSRKEPCGSRRRQSPEIGEVLEAAGRYWYVELLPKGGRSKVRDVSRSLIWHAAKHGELVAVRIDGEERRAVRFDASCRQVAVGASTTPMSASRSIRRLREIGAIRRDDGHRRETDGGAILIIEPATQRYTLNNSSAEEGQPKVDEGCNVASRLLRPDELRTPAPRWGDHIGNARGGTLYALEAFGPQTREVLAERLGYARPRDYERSHLRPLIELGLVEERGGVYALPGEYAERFGELRATPYSTVRRVRRRRRTDEGRTVTESIEVGAVASADERERADRERFKHEAAGWRAACERGEVHRRGEARRPQALAGTADGTISELRLVGLEEAVHAPEQAPFRLALPDPAVVAALRAFLRRNPHRRGEAPGWLGVALWADELLPIKPTPSGVAAALAELSVGRGAA